MRKLRLKRHVACHVNCIVIYWLLEQKENVQTTFLQIYPIDCKCHFMVISLYFGTILRVYFLASDIINQEFYNEESRFLRRNSDLKSEKNKII